MGGETPKDTINWVQIWKFRGSNREFCCYAEEQKEVVKIVAFTMLKAQKWIDKEYQRLSISSSGNSYISAQGLLFEINVLELVVVNSPYYSDIRAKLRYIKNFQNS